ncbi:MAG TPA: hypothetical protein VHQ47_21205 [Phycisphaerae bacterium]|nr:hypothetical protein [Phycisphaerae bacterium]
MGVLVVGLGMGALCVGQDGAVRGEGAATMAAELRVMVAVPEGGVWDDSRPIEVVLENVTGKPMELFQSWNSWGYSNVRLEWEAEGQRGTVKRVARAWSANFPSTTTVPAGGAMVREVTMGDNWTGWPALKSGMKLTVRAMYESNQKGGKGWLGEAESEAVTMEVGGAAKP